MATPRFLEKFDEDAGDFQAKVGGLGAPGFLYDTKQYDRGPAQTAGIAFGYTFPLRLYEWEQRGPMRSALSPVSGANYAYDHRGLSPNLRGVAEELIRFIALKDTEALLDAEIDNLKAKLYRIGRGRLYTLGADGTRRWARARLASMPELTLAVGSKLHLPVSLAFQRLSDWFSANAIEVAQTVTASGQTWTIINTGNLPAVLMVVRLRANTGAGFVNPKLENLANGLIFETARDSTPLGEVRLDTERLAVEYSTDNGASYANDFANYVLPAKQLAASFRLEPGVNSIRYTGGGTPNLDVVFRFYAPFA